MVADFGFVLDQSTLHDKNPKANHQLIITYKNYTYHVAKGIAWPSKPLLSLWLTAWYVGCTVIPAKHSIHISYSFTFEFSVRATSTCSCQKWMKQSDYYWLLMVNLFRVFTEADQIKNFATHRKFEVSVTCITECRKKVTLLLTP